jgi:ABC-type multidrug transport system permease subunit
LVLSRRFGGLIPSYQEDNNMQSSYNTPTINRRLGPEYLRHTTAVFAKDIRQWARDRQAAMGPMLIPLVLMIISTIIFGFGGDEWNIGLVVEDSSPVALRFVQAIQNSSSNISPYYRIITRDAQEADRLVTEGRLQMVVTIPTDFGTRIAAGEVPELQTKLFNINTDMMKNVRLRLQHTIQDFLVEEKRAPLQVVQYTTRPDDVWRRAFIAGGAVVIAILIGAALNTAIMAAREWERRTDKEIRLAPRAFAGVITGKLLAGLAATAINVLVTLIVAVWIFGLRIAPDRWLPLIGVGVLVAVSAAGIGLGIGALFRDYRTLQPLLLVVAAGSFFASGGYGSVATLPPFVRAFDVYWPLSYAFETMQIMMHGSAIPDISGVIMGMVAAAFISLGFGALMLRRAM